MYDRQRCFPRCYSQLLGKFLLRDIDRHQAVMHIHIRGGWEDMTVAENTHHTGRFQLLTGLNIPHACNPLLVAPFDDMTSIRSWLIRSLCEPLRE